ncbi:alpha/beta hydrolase [Virgibacillus litoralis]|uniref:Enterochelin esterase-like enzyme n=1 Tax=Virgibacillus litoralis TaxID=578221 RepID=A0ABS4HC02_9BACI|nr:alpha/beta hydrolase-fold protein [Virgibacillus litoralis]MBP1948421.1 enterochelin esterase-like enzyme [Virgibacillus litoralis]
MGINKKFKKSNFLNKDIEYYVLRSNTTIEEAYLLYVHDGGDYLELGELEKSYQKLLQHDYNRARKLVFVLISPGSSSERWNSYHRRGKDFDNYIDFMNQELIPEVEQELSDSGIKIVKRGMLGDSLAGNISLNIAVSKPRLWTHLLLQSAAISKHDIESLSDMQQVNWNIYQTVGLYEDEFISPITDEKLYILSRNRELYSAFLALKIHKIRYIECKEHHLWDFWRRDLPNVLHYFTYHS